MSGSWVNRSAAVALFVNRAVNTVSAKRRRIGISCSDAVEGVGVEFCDGRLLVIDVSFDVDAVGCDE